MQLVAFSAVLWSISHTLVAFLAVYALLGTFGALYLFGAPLVPGSISGRSAARPISVSA